MIPARFLKAYGAAVLTCLGLDAIWLGVVAKDFFAAHLGHVLAPEPNLTLAACFYLVYAAGIVIFAAKPGWASTSWRAAGLYGALFGFMAYGTYDITNLATIRDWPVVVALVDISWGTALTALAAITAYKAGAKVA